MSLANHVSSNCNAPRYTCKVAQSRSSNKPFSLSSQNPFPKTAGWTQSLFTVIWDLVIMNTWRQYFKSCCRMAGIPFISYWPQSIRLRALPLFTSNLKRSLTETCGDKTVFFSWVGGGWWGDLKHWAVNIASFMFSQTHIFLNQLSGSCRLLAFAGSRDRRAQEM